ncbi:hypothetical protein F4678DRAFT_433670 [Xylaria arbuscula]|nr:hypothetical protein F4678DRAFT_433670 [Xylaria arbuscula]
MMASYVVSDGQLLNNKYDEDYSFPQFALLPWELRNQVWRSFLQKRRFIRVALSDTQPVGFSEQESSDIKYGPCYLIVNGFQLLSKLLRVNSEARKAALEFYRVRLPSVLTMHLALNEGTQIGAFPFNPEHDVLWFEDAHSLPDFLSTIATYDSRRIGLCNLAVSLTGIEHTLEADDPDKYQYPVFTQALSNIREFYLVIKTNSYYLETRKTQYNNPDYGVDTPMTQSLSPLMSNVPSFDILRRDPRSIQRDLARLYLGSNNIPREIAWWKAVIGEWGVDHSQVKSRILFAYHDWNPCLPVEDSSPEGPEIQRSHIPNTDRHLHASSSSLVPAIQLTVEKEASKTEDAPAFGFWLFPLDAFTDENRVLYPHLGLNIWNLSDHWPELALIRLPAGSSSK